MTLLVDNQLPLALARYLAANGWECTHVQDIGMGAVEDTVI
jgi:predicted nuclease of predicted toxin-antitoxin system